MKKSVLEYKGYYADVEFDVETSLLHGKISGIDDLVTFESNEAGEIVTEFHSAVDDYLALCRDMGKIPEKGFYEVSEVSISSRLHELLQAKAVEEGISLNDLTEQACYKYLKLGQAG